MKRILPAGIVLLALTVASCAPEIVEEPFEPSASHADYRSALERLELDETALGSDWITAGEQALRNPVVVETPFRETGFLDPQDPSALGYEFAVERGRAVSITIASEADRYFADLYRVEDPDSPDSRATVLVGSRPDEGSEIRFEPRRDGWYLLRIQPELLRGGRFDLEIVATASLSFPVDGADPGDVWSFYGDGRDGGIRMHEGIDIFGTRGTYLLAASDSVVARVGERDRGGNIVTLYDEERDLLLYYAHLDEQLVTQGQRVRRGDPIGTMGNTGNAITTPPHLHIGIYQGSWRNDVDPWNYFVDPPLVAPDPPAFAELAGRWFSVAEPAEMELELRARTVPARFVNRNPLLRQEGAGDGRTGRMRTREAEDDHGEPLPHRERLILEPGEAVEVVGAAGSLVRVRSATGREGFVGPGRLSQSDRLIRLREPTVVRDLRGRGSFARLEAGEEVAFVGRAGNDVVVVLPGGRVAKVPAADAQL